MHLPKFQLNLCVDQKIKKYVPKRKILESFNTIFWLFLNVLNDKTFQEQ